MYDVVPLATDGNESATRAATNALEQADSGNAELHALYVVDTTRLAEPALGSGEIETNDVEVWGQREIEEIVDRAGSLDLDVRTRCCHGKPHVEIVEYANTIDAELVILGYQGHSHSDPGQLGSVSDRVVRDAGRPVLVA